MPRLSTSARWRLPVVVGVVALALRLWVLFEERAGNPLFRLAILDDGQYLDLAAAYADGSPARPWFLAPLYPYLLSVVAASARPSMLAASLLNVVAGTLTAVCAALAARDLVGRGTGDRAGGLAGWLAGGALALSGTFVFHDALPGQEPLLCLLHVAAFWAGLRWLRSGSPPAAGAAGLAAGVASMGRATSLGIAVAAAALALTRLRPARRALPGLAALLLGLAVVLVPAALRNRSVAGDLTPFPWSGGVNLYVANGPDARAETAFVARELGFSPAEMEVNARRIAEAAAGRALAPSEISSYWARRTREDSGGAAALAAHLARKAALFFAAGEYGSNHYAPLERRFSLWLRLVPVSSWWLLVLGAGGWWIVRRRLPAADLAALTVLMTWGALTVVYPVSRYRLPIVPLAAILAAAGIAEIVVRGAAIPRRRRVVAAALVAACAALALGHAFVRTPPSPIASYTNVGSALAREGRGAEAEEVLREGLAERPGDGPARLALGRVLMLRGDHAGALEQFALSEKDPRTQWAAGVPAVLCLVETGQIARAEGVGALLAQRLPQDPALRGEMLAWWALAAAARGDTRAAGERLAAARRLAPGLPAVAEAERRLSAPR